MIKMKANGVDVLLGVMPSVLALTIGAICRYVKRLLREFVHCREKDIRGRCVDVNCFGARHDGWCEFCGVSMNCNGSVKWTERKHSINCIRQAKEALARKLNSTCSMQSSQRSEIIYQLAVVL